MSVYSEGGTTYPDVLIGLIYLTWVVLGISLNLCVLRFNITRPYIVPKFLFALLAATDLLTLAIVAVFCAAKFLESGQPKCALGKNPQQPSVMHCYSVTPSVPTYIYGITAWFLTQSSGVFTALLATCRMVQIMRPFKIIKIQVIARVVGCYAGVTLAVLCVWFTWNGAIFTYSNLSLWSPNIGSGSDNPRTKAMYNSIFLYSANIIGQFIAFVASIVTVVHLYKVYKNPIVRRSRSAGKQGSSTIIMTNAGAVLQLVSIAIINKLIFSVDWESRKPNTGMSFIILAVCNMMLPVIMSVFNPLIFISCTPNFYRGCKWKRQTYSDKLLMKRQTCKMTVLIHTNTVNFPKSGEYIVIQRKSRHSI